MITYQEVDISTIVPDPDNPRTITVSAMRALTASVKRFGPVQPILINKTTGHIVGGHQRLAALRKLGHKSTMVAFGEWTLAEERALNVTLNNPAVQGKFERPDDYLDGALQGLSLADFRELNLESVFPKETKEKRQADGLTYKIVVTCDDERHQADLIERLEADGLTCSPLIA
jgi:hypothetical protein